MTAEQVWFYVAADPLQPGAAWAICVDKPEFAKDTTKTVAGYIKQGATVMRVDRETGMAMLDKWVRPVKPKKNKPASQPALI
jgi:hypothetical protein